MSYIGKQPRKAALTSSDIEDGIITAAKSEDGAVVAAEIASNAVTTAKINADAVTAAKIADNAVVTAGINAGAVTSAKLTYPLTTFSSTGIDDNATSTAMTIDSSEKVTMTRPRNNTLGNSALQILPSDTAVGYGFRVETSNNDLVFEKSAPSGSEAELLRFKAGGGIALGGTGTANTLDDYEEGTFTPVISFGGGTTGIQYDTQLGFYTKIGREVTIFINVALTNKGSSTGNAVVAGFPFTSASTSVGVGAVSGYKVANTGHMSMRLNDNNTTGTFQQLNSSGVLATLQNSAFSNDSEFQVTGIFFT